MQFSEKAPIPDQSFAQNVHADIDRISKYASAELIGRDDELNLLWDAWEKVEKHESNRPHILIFVALGG